MGKRKAVSLVVIIVAAVGLALGWVSTKLEVATLNQGISDLQKDLDESRENNNNLQQGYNALNSTYNTLNSNYSKLQQRCSELEENLKPNFSSGLTYNQLIAWDYLRIALNNASISLANEYMDDYILLSEFKMGNIYIVGLVFDMINDIEAIRENATTNWNAPIDKFIEAAQWDIKGFDNYSLYLDTEIASYYAFYQTCYSNAGEAQTSAWNLMPV